MISLQGNLSEEEYAILDELNGLVLAGEIALERLQKAGESRVATSGRPFSNHYDLAAHLLKAAGSVLTGEAGETALGRIDLLFDLLIKLSLATPEAMKAYISRLHPDIERQPLADQIIDQLLEEDDSRYKLYEDVRMNRPVPGDIGPAMQGEIDPEFHQAFGFFLAQWINFERTLRLKSGRVQGEHFQPMSIQRTLKSLGLSDEILREIERIRRVRNNLVHGIETPNSLDLYEDAIRLQLLTDRINQKLNDTDG
ncbi:MAG: hypothetical protein ACT4PN_01210 [Nitrospiraceae bacterium]